MVVEIDTQNWSLVDCEMQQRFGWLFDTEDCNGEDDDKRSGKTLETNGHPHPKCFHMLRWETAFASSLGKETGDMSAMSTMAGFCSGSVTMQNHSAKMDAVDSALSEYADVFLGPSPRTRRKSTHEHSW